MRERTMMSRGSKPGSLSFDSVAHIYDDTRGYTEEVSAAIADGMMRYGPLAPGAHALEIGIGTGRIALPLLERGVHVSGVDISERMVERLRAKYAAACAARPTPLWGALNVTLGDVTALPYPDGAFDAVVGVHIFHLVSQWRKALDEALRVLRQGAPLLLGQDVYHGSTVTHPLQDEWVQIVRSLGGDPQRLGASSYSEILDEAEERHLRVEEWTLAYWTVAHTPADGFRDIAERTWSLTWLVPDDIFTESVRRLEVWARANYGREWDTPISTRCSFKLARVTAPNQ